MVCVGSPSAEGSVFDFYSAVYVLPEVFVTAAAYYYATRIPFQMDAFKSWARMKRNQGNIGMDAVSTLYLFDEMKTDAIGIGKGIFHVNAELMAKLASSVGTFFLVIAPANKQ
ncbi:unnamed protein product [Orchesella dallaii]|uniref:Uncharacterized protein n=1 Tax=Orchesella dallaii TaxID=48710 RepID=A0ABP1RYC7_9HEXA